MPPFPDLLPPQPNKFTVLETFLRFHTPTVAAGQINHHQELRYKYLALQFATELGLRLTMTPEAILRATVLLQRFFLFKVVGNRLYNNQIAGACLLVAGKLDDCLRNIKAVVLAAVRLLENVDGSETLLPHYWLWRDGIAKYEEAVIKTLAFDLDTPPLFDTLGEVFPREQTGSVDTPVLFRHARTFVIEALKVGCLCVFDEAAVVATAAVFAGLKTNTLYEAGWLAERGVRINAIAAYRCYSFVFSRLLDLVALKACDPKLIELHIEPFSKEMFGEVAGDPALAAKENIVDLTEVVARARKRA